MKNVPEIENALICASMVADNALTRTETEEVIFTFVRNIIRAGSGNMNVHEVAKALHGKVID